jgi:ABC-type transporter Mla subunit MlaD
MSSDRSRAVRAGVVVAAALAVLAAFVLTLSARNGLFTRQAHYRARFGAIQGLSEGAQVRFRGVTVGTVRSVELSPDPASNDVIVELAVTRSLAARMDRHVVAEIRTSGALGDKLLELKREDVPPEEALPLGAEIRTRTPTDLFGTGGDVLTDVRSIAGSLDVITSRLVAGEGVVGRLLKDKDYGERVLTDLEVTIAQVREIVDRSADGRNLLGTLLSDERLAQDVQASLRRSLVRTRT